MKNKNIMTRLTIGCCVGALASILTQKKNIQQVAGDKEKLVLLLSTVAGVICGICLAAVAVLIIKKLGGKMDGLYREDGYDERQLAVRGLAYKAAYGTLMWYVGIISLLSEILDISWFMSFSGMWLGICLSILVFTVLCIVKDAYMSFYSNAKGILMISSFVGLINLGIGIGVILNRNPLLVDGKLSSLYINLIVGILFCITTITFLGKIIYNRKHREEDEE